MNTIDKLVDGLVKPLPKQGRKKGRTIRKKSTRRGRGIARNRGRRPQPSGRDPGLALTRDQFTATSPLNLFTVTTGSTPGGIRVKGRELIGAATAVAALTGAFAQLNIAGVTPFLLNPVNFPRLAAYAPIYEYFKFHKCDVLFQSNQPTTAIGEALAAVDYDVKDTAPASAVAMMRNISSTMANVYSDASLQILGSLSRLPKYATAETTGPDASQVNQAAVYIAAEGVTAAIAATLGYVVVMYDVEFFTPQ